MSEYLLESTRGGSVANVAYNPCGVSSTSQLLYAELLDNLFRHGERCLGRAVFAARCSIIARYPDDDSIYGPAILWTLLGDPALRVKHRIGSGVEEGLQPQATSCTLTAVPNPCDAMVRVTLPARLRTADCRLVGIYNASGLLVCLQRVRGSSFVLRTSSFSSGVYVVRCVSGTDFARLTVLHPQPASGR